MMRAKAYPVATVNGTVELDLPGQYFKLLSASAARVVDLQLLNDGSEALNASQVTAGFYQRVAFNKVRITDTAAQNVVILAAPDEGGQDSIAGIVDVNPFAGPDAIAVAAAAFDGGMVNFAVAAQNGSLQLFNPAASGKVLYCDGLMGGMAAAGFMDVSDHNAALATLINAGRNRNLGGAAGGGVLRQSNQAGFIGTTRHKFVVAANIEVPMTFSPPIRIPEGRGLIVQGSVVNVDVSGSFFWREKTT